MAGEYSIKKASMLLDLFAKRSTDHHQMKKASAFTLMKIRQITGQKT